MTDERDERDPALVGQTEPTQDDRPEGLRETGLALADALRTLDARARVDMPLSSSVPAPGPGHAERLRAALDDARDALDAYCAEAGIELDEG